MKSCDEVMVLVMDLLPDHLAALGALRGEEQAEVLAVHEHLRACPGCAEVADDLLRTAHLLREQAPAAPALSPDFADRVMAALPAAPGAVAPGPGRRTLLALAAGVLLFASGFGAASLRPRVVVVVEHGPPLQGSDPSPPAPVEPAPADAPGRVVVDAGRGGEEGTPIAVAPPPRPPAQGAAAPRERPTTSAPLERYVEEAGLVVRALGALEQPDPHWLGVLSRRVEGAALIAEGDRLLVALDRAPASEDTQALRPLISATQVVLRKVRRSSGQEPGVALDALRREVAATGLLDAYRDLADGVRPTADEPEAPRSFASTDPL